MTSSGNSPVQDGGASCTLLVDSRQFSREAVLRAAYWFSNELYVEVPVSNSEHSFEVVLRSKCSRPTLENPSPTALDELVSEFRNALIESELRIQVQRETSSVRELILAKAFAEAGVLESSPPGSFSDPVLAARKPEPDVALAVGSEINNKVETPK